MGCFESSQQKQQKQRAKYIKVPKIHQSQFNLRWKRLLQNPHVKKYIITDYNHAPTHPAFRSIQKDVDRTFPNHSYFNYSHNRFQFGQTLKCFALTFPRVGYTQGLNFITGFFLLNKFNKQQCLTILANICTHPSLMSIGLYEDSFPLTHLYCKLFWKLLDKIDIKLHSYLKSIQIPDYMWIFQWFLTFFIYSFPLQYISPFFNYIFEHKQFAMVKLSLGITLCLRQKILNLPEKDELVFAQFLQSLKTVTTCVKVLNLTEIMSKAQQISDQMIKTSLKEIKKNRQINNFYLKYFLTQPSQRKELHQQFMHGIQDKKNQLQKSRHNNKLMQGYKRSRQTVQILDQIMFQSLKKIKNRKYKSTVSFVHDNSLTVNSQFAKWKSLIPSAYESNNYKNQDQTTVSNVRKYIIPEEKD